MICFVALFVFAVLGIFSATHRKLAKEAFDCVLRKTTFRKCQSDLDKRLKADISGWFLKRWPAAGRTVYKYFSIFSWILIILTVASILGVAWGGYNYYLYGNCNGQGSDDFCVFDPTGSNSAVSHTDSEECTTPELLKASLNQDVLDTSQLITLTQGSNQVMFIGCYGCPYTREAYPRVLQAAQETDTQLLFAHFGVKPHHELMTPVLLCLQEDASAVLAYNEYLFAADTESLEKEQTLRDAITAAGADVSTVLSCAQRNQTLQRAANYTDMLEATNIYGTPLIFIDEESYVGPKPTRVYKRLMK